MERYGYAHSGEAVEVVNLRVRAEGPAPAVSSAFGGEGSDSEPARRGTRAVLLDGARTECPVYARERLRPGDRLAGPALAVSVDSTCLLLGGQVAEVDELGNLLIREASDT